MQRYSVLLCSVALLVLADCGSSSGTNPFALFDFDLTETLPIPVRGLEGSLAGNGLRDTDAPLRVGDDANNASWRAFTSFSLNEPKPGRTLRRAGLRLFQGGLMGNPYSRMGLLFVERIDMGAGLDGTDWGATAGARAIGWSDPAPGEIEIDVTTLVQEAMTLGTSRLDLRLRFSVTVIADGSAQQTRFSSYNQGVEPLTLGPILELHWQPSP